MRFYGMTPREVLDTPMRLFWLLVRNIDRIRAQEHLQKLPLHVAGTSPQGADELSKDLERAMGTVMENDVVEEPLDREGLESLRQLR